MIDMTKCCLCGNEFKGFGNNPDPLMTTGRCCDVCYHNVNKFRELTEPEILRKAHPDYSPRRLKKYYEELRVGVRHMCLMGEQI